MNRERLWLLFPRQVRELPADLAAALALVALTNLAVFVPVVNDSPLRVVFGLAFVLFVPGYAFIAALFPEAGEPPRANDAEGVAGSDGDPAAPEGGASAEGASDEGAFLSRDRGIDGIERVALSFGLSIAIVPLIGLALNFTPFGIRLVPILASVSGFTVVAIAIAAIRRWELPEDERFRVPYREWIAAGKRELFEPESTVDAALNVALAVAIVLAMSSVVYAVAVPPQGEQFTEFYVLTEGNDGELVADGYPAELVVGEPEALHVGIGNNEYETVEYTVVVQLQRLEGEGNESTVVDRTELDRFSTTVAHNETWIEQRNVTATGEQTGENLRLTFLLYDSDVPGTPTRENAYRNLHLWVDVRAE